MPFLQHCRTVLAFALPILLSLKSTALQEPFQQPRCTGAPCILLSSNHSATYLTITALTSFPTPPHHPQFTCLRLPTPLNTYPTTGSSVPLSLPLSSGRNMTLVTLPPKSSEGWHNPPMPMWFVLLRGRAVVTTYDPRDDDESRTSSSTLTCDDRHEDQSQLEAVDERLPSAPTRETNKCHDDVRRQKVTISVGSPNQFLLALDLLGQGHWTEYPSDEETWALQIPLAEGWEKEIRRWEVVGDGACT